MVGNYVVFIFFALLALVNAVDISWRNGLKDQDQLQMTSLDVIYDGSPRTYSVEVIDGQSKVFFECSHPGRIKTLILHCAYGPIVFNMDDKMRECLVHDKPLKLIYDLDTSALGQPALKNKNGRGCVIL
jgi:hypothetical protein